MCVIQWCNDNNGFLSAVLSFIGLFLSVTAIVVSIQTARLPYKKKLLLSYCILLDVDEHDHMPIINGIEVSATNISNRPIILTIVVPFV